MRYIGETLLLASCLALGGQATPIRLQTTTIEPDSLPARPMRTARLMSAAVAEAESVYLLQCPERPTESWRRQVKLTGARILAYIPENAYLVKATPSEAECVQARVPHSYFGDYCPEFRVSPQGTDKTRRWLVSVFESADCAAVVAAAAAYDDISVMSVGETVVAMEMPVTRLGIVAAVDGVEWIEPALERRLKTNMAVKPLLMNVEPVWPGGGSGLDLTGAGQVIAIADSGLDTGSLETLHPDVQGRVARTYALGRRNDWSDSDGHGTHVAGCAVGDGGMMGIRGPAWRASLVFQSVLDARGGMSGLPNDLTQLFGPAYAAGRSDGGARIHNNSWGVAVQGQYTLDSRAVDKFVYSHPDFLVVCSAGNEGVDRDRDGVVDLGSVNAPATAKNCLAVGASENYRTRGGLAFYPWGAAWPSDYPAAPLRGDRISSPADGQHQGIAAFSSRGPCRDGRIKPDLIAPGTDIVAMRSSLADADGYWDVMNARYAYMGGTSMSTPLVSGAAALVREWLESVYGIDNPDAATVRALLLAGARSLTPGQYGTGSTREIPATYPNNVEGWGQVDVEAAVGRNPLVYDGQVIAQGETAEVVVDVASGSSPVFMLVYADAPASPASSRQLVNDLDLTVETPSGEILYPNSRTSADRTNPVEGIRLDGAEGGSYKIRVQGYGIPTPMDTALTGRANAIRYSLVILGSKGEGTGEPMAKDAWDDLGGLTNTTVFAVSGRPLVSGMAEYNGVLVGRGNAIAGTVQLKCGKMDPATGACSVTATVKTDGKNTWSYKGSLGVRGLDGLTPCELVTSARQAPVSRFSVRLSAGDLWGSYGEWSVQGSINGSLIAGHEMLTRLDEFYRGAWTISCASSAGRIRLLLSVGARGVVSVKGVMPDGTMFTTAAQLVFAREAAAVAVVVSLPKKNGLLRMLVRLSEDGTTYLCPGSRIEALTGEMEMLAVVDGGPTCRPELSVAVADPVLPAGVTWQEELVVPECAYPVKFSATKLPTGLKLNGSTGVISGVPTRPGVFSAVIKATSGTNAKWTSILTNVYTVTTMPDWAFGTFNGGGVSNLVTLTVAKNTGRISGKRLQDGLTWTLSATSFAWCSNEVYKAHVIEKSGRFVMTNEVSLVRDEKNPTRGLMESDEWVAYRNLWKIEPWRSWARSFTRAPLQTFFVNSGGAVSESLLSDTYGTLAVRFSSSGTATVKGTFTTGVDARTGKAVVYSATCSSVMIPEEDGTYRVFVYYPVKAGRFPGWCGTMAVEIPSL